MAKKIVLVTGANRGIGREVCKQLAALDYTVLLTARDRAKAEAAARALGAGVHALALDVASDESVKRAASEASERFGRVDVLVNNAGIHYDSFEGVLDADWRIIHEAYETNVFGAWRCAQAFAPGMRARRWGRIVNVSSQVGSLASMGAGTPAYASSKAALNALTRVLAGELRGSGVLVNSICPGWVATDMGGAGGRPVEEGGASVVWGVTLDDRGPTGGFFRDGQPLAW